MTETNRMVQVNPRDLSIRDTVNVSKQVEGITTTIAHPHINSDGSWLTMGIYRRGFRAYYEFLRYKNDPASPSNQSSNICERAEVIARIPGGLFSLSYFHSFAVTENYIVFVENALRFDFKRVVESILFNKSISNILVMDKSFAARIHVIDKRTGVKLDRKFVTEPLCVLHHINAYENAERNEILVDVCSYDVEYLDINEFTRENMLSDKLLGSKMLKSLARRIRVPLSGIGITGREEIYCSVTDINSDVSFELPAINYAKYNGRPYTYAYGTSLYTIPFTVVKLNVNSGQQWKVNYDQDGLACLPSEPVFVPDPAGSREDDGCLLVMVLSDKHDFLSVLDARDLSEIARAVVPANVKAAFTFHGFFADSKTFPNFNK